MVVTNYTVVTTARITNMSSVRLPVEILETLNSKKPLLDRVLESSKCDHWIRLDELYLPIALRSPGKASEATCSTSLTSCDDRHTASDTGLTFVFTTDYAQVLEYFQKIAL